MKILLAESDPNIRYGLSILSEQLAEKIVMEEATDSHELLHTICTSCPDVLLISQKFLGLHGGNLLAELHQICHQLLIIILSINSPGIAVQLPDNPSNHIKVVQKPEQLYALLEKTCRTQQRRGNGSTSKI